MQTTRSAGASQQHEVRRGGAPVTSLAAEDVVVRFGGVVALTGVNVSCARGEVLGLIGPNGSGKTTMINVLSGFVRATAGRVAVDGAVVRRPNPVRLAALGVGRTFQGVRLFQKLTVFDNVLAAELTRTRRGRSARANVAARLRDAGLDDVAFMPAGNLSYGVQRLVSLTRTAALRPRFLLLDEPAAGLNEQESDQLAAVIRTVHAADGCGVLIVEHDMRLIMQLCDRIQVLEGGETIAAGTPADIRSDRRVIEAYLGSEEI